jgi:hypothetical protein
MRIKQKTLTFILIIFITISFIFAIEYIKQNPTKEQPSVTENKPTNNYELRKQCIQSCEEYFCKTYGGVFKKTGNGVVLRYYDNYYNKKLNKCFMLIEEEDRDSKRKELLAIDESKTYGLFLHKEGSIIQVCSVADKVCKSEEEWDLLVKPFMGG